MTRTPPIAAQLNDLLAKHANERVNGKVASMRTQELTHDVLHKVFKDLKRLGYHLEKPQNIGDRHIEALVKLWHEEGKANSTMQNQLSRLRIFADWIGKPGLVRKKGIPAYLPEVAADTLVVRVNADHSKAWITNGIDVVAKIRQAERVDDRFGLMLMMQLAFGLRREEVLKCRPWKADEGEFLRVFPGEGKNGRPRLIPIQNAQQRAILVYVKSRVKITKAIGWEYTASGDHATLEKNIRRYAHCAEKVGMTKKDAGVTGHGLRAQFAENAALLAKFVPPTLGGDRHMADANDLLLGRMKVAEALGHSEISITGPYYGQFKRGTPTFDPTAHKRIIESGLKFLATRREDEQILPERLTDVGMIVVDLSTHGIQMTPMQAHALWRVHSKRHASSWLKPGDGIREAITVASWQLVQDDARGQHSLELVYATS